ncbi:MAG: AAA domain-containing protein [Xenococcaceae cyanobacterium]
MNLSNSNNLYRIRITDVGEYIRYHSCDRRFRLKFNNYKEVIQTLPSRLSQSIFQTSLDPILEEAGRLNEQQWSESLIKRNFTPLTANSEQLKPVATTWHDFTENLADVRVGESAYGREIRICGEIGKFELSGQIDFVLLLWEGDTPKLRLVEGKASRKDRTYHRIQIALYQLLVCQEITKNPIYVDAKPIKPEQVEAVVVRIDEQTNQGQDILALDPFEFETFEADIDYLLRSEGKLGQILEKDLDELDYQLDAKCSDCLLSVHCLSESARQHRLQLLGIDTSTIQILKTAGIITIDDLADLDLTGKRARQVRENIGFSSNLEQLKTQAQSRRRTLPGCDSYTNEYEVKQLPSSSNQQTLLPKRVINNLPLLRVFLSVEYEYVENRIVALCAHLTNSEGKLDTKFDRSPIAVVQELLETEEGYIERPLKGQDLIEFKQTAWTGNYEQDTEAERRLIRSFFRQLITHLKTVANTSEAPIHFYVWSRQEMTQLIEGCTRCGSDLLAHLRKLMGCRRELEQQIYTCLDQEVARCYALGWTGRDLAVVTNLRWFAYKYHWCREVEGETVFLDRKGAFWRDIFDFIQYGWSLNHQGHWEDTSSSISTKFPLEIRLRYFNSISAAYWRGYWGTLPNPDSPDVDRKTQKAIQDYRQAEKPGYLREYLCARTHALRWIEERFPDWLLNDEIEKPLVNLDELEKFSLGINTIAQASLDFLQLDHYVKKTDWITTHLTPPLYRLTSGRTLPLRDVSLNATNDYYNRRLTANIDLDNYDLSSEVVQANCTIEEGAFVRVSPCYEDPHRGQSFKQLTTGIGFNCIVRSINWQQGTVELDVNGARAGYYILSSSGKKQSGIVFPHASLDESPSDFVARRVDPHLTQSLTHFVNQWFEPTDPQIPPLEPIDNNKIEIYQTYLETLLIKGYPLHCQQITAILEGLKSRVQLLLGPPGTGKTNTTAIATFLRIVARHHRGDIVLLSASTHTAVNELICRIDEYLPTLEFQAQQQNIDIPRILLSRADIREEHKHLFEHSNVELFNTYKCTHQVQQMRSEGVLVIAGTVSSLLKIVESFQKSRYNFSASMLIVDEASMMVFPYFLALGTLINPKGTIMLAGDHRQLAPIVAHDWEREDRPPVIEYQPFVSAYQAIAQLKAKGIPDESLVSSALTYTFRLPAEIRHLIARLYRHKDGIELEGKNFQPSDITNVPQDNPWQAVWHNPYGLLLVVHSEANSQRTNSVEIEIIQQILDNSDNLAENSVAIITPHRAQRTQLKTRLFDYDSYIRVIDTVEKLQGGECDNIFVSATASDPTAIGKNVEFILDLNRSNVAFSRVQKRLVVVCAQSLLNYIPAELDNYEETMLWKALRSICTECLASTTVDGYEVKILSVSPEFVESNLNSEEGL